MIMPVLLSVNTSDYNIFRPHCSTKYTDVAYCYRPSSVVCLSVGLSR